MISFLISAIIFIVSFLVVLSFLVFFHELGHYSVGRFFGVAVERFSIGFGKPIAKWKAKSGTEWVIGRYPLGGYVKFLGDSGAASNPDHDKLKKIEDELKKDGHQDISDVFHFKPVWQRALIVLAGPVMNFLLAIVIFAGLALTVPHYEVEAVVVEVVEGMPAEKAGVMVGDKFLTMNGTDVSERDKTITYVSIRSGDAIKTEVLRDGRVVDLEITPERMPRRDALGGINNLGMIGVKIGGAEYAKLQEYNLVSALGRGTERVGETLSATGTYIGRIFMGKEDGKAFGGPARIATYTGKTAVDIVNEDRGWGWKLYALYVSLFSIAAAISVGLGVANLMPIPALDGGHLLYYGYEALAGRPLSVKKQEYGFRIGLALILMLFVYFTINDFGYIQSFGT